MLVEGDVKHGDYITRFRNVRNLILDFITVQEGVNVPLRGTIVRDENGRGGDGLN